MPIDLPTLLIDPVERRGMTLSRCPVSSHGKGQGDRNRSLQTRRGHRGWLLKCWSGCDLAEICQAMGLRISDLFNDAPLPHDQRPTPKPVRADRCARAFEFDLVALDLRLRADRVMEVGQRFNVATLSNEDLDRALDLVAQAYADIERAEMLEQVADDLRERDVTERISREQRRRAG